MAGVLIVVVLSPYALSLPPTLGADWTWYRDGPARMLAGLPLYDPVMLRGPFDYLALGERWNMPPWALPFALAFFPLGQSFWWIVTMDALVASLMLVRPRLPPRHAIPIAVAVLISPPFIMGMLWGNMESLAALGVALWFVGQRKRWWWLEAAGIALAGTKVLPAIPLAAWSTIRDHKWRPIAGAFVLTAVLSLPAMLYGGLGVLHDFLQMEVNMIIVNTPLNLSPMKIIDPLLVRLFVVAGLVSAMALPRTLAVPLMLLLVSLAVPNLYATWFLLPSLAVLASIAPGSEGTRETVPSDT